MDAKEFHCFMCAQIQEMLKYKWIESEKLGFDIGENRACTEWIEKYSAKFYEYWKGK